MSPRAWLAAILPKRNGSSTNAGKKSTLWTATCPGGTRTTAASSGASSPSSTSGPATGWSGAPGPASRLDAPKRSSARKSNSLPTFEPHPPQRIAGEARAPSSAPADPTPDRGAAAGPRGPAPSPSIEGKSVNSRMNRRSIRSFHRQTQRPLTVSPLRAPTAWRRPVEMRLRYSRCGRKPTRGRPRRRRCRLRASGIPWRTANTPAFGRGWPRTAAMSPAAKTSGWLSVCNVSRTRMKPRSSTSRPDSRGQSGAPAVVTQRISSKTALDPSSKRRVRPSTRVTRWRVCTATPSLSSIRAKEARMRRG